VKLGALWIALCAGDPAVIEAAYLHRAHRERGRIYLKGRDDIAADWGSVLGLDRTCEVLADCGDAAVVRVGSRIWHQWVRREGERIAREVLVVEGGPGLSGSDLLVAERETKCGGTSARLAHLFVEAGDGTPLRHVVSRFSFGEETRVAVGEAVLNG
jgi:hypothetical protein